MKEKTSQKIIKLIKEKGQLSPVELTDSLGLSDRAVRKQLKSLYEKGVLAKKGKPPRVFYYIKTIFKRFNSAYKCFKRMFKYH